MRILKGFFLVIAFMATMIPVHGQWESMGSGLTPSPTEPKAIFSIAVVTEDVVWAVPISGFQFNTRDVIKTTDGGESWNHYLLPELTGTFMPLRVFALDESKAWVVLVGYPSQSSSVIFHTADGGATWVNQAGPFNDPLQSVQNVHFFDEMEGVAFGSPNTGNLSNDVIKIFRTSNGGSTWTPILSINLPIFLTGEKFLPNDGNDSYAAVGDTIWFTTTQNRIMRTVDRGANWTAIFTPLPGSTTPAGLASIAFRDHLNGLVVSFQPQQGARTTDGGQTWTVIEMPAEPSARSVKYLPGTDGAYLISDGYTETSPAIAYTLNEGENWGVLDGNPQFNTLDFLSSTSGWGGTNVASNGSGMYKWTSDWLLNLNVADAKLKFFSVYPNPTFDEIRLTFINHITSFATIRIFDALGKQVETSTFQPSAGLSFSLGSLPRGVYVLTVQVGEMSSVEKIVKL